MGGVAGKEEVTEDRTIWLSERASARIQGEDKPYEELLRKIQTKHDTSVNLTLDRFKEMSTSVEDQLHDRKKEGKEEPLSSAGDL